MDYKEKYLKYKNKYLQLKTQIGYGAENVINISFYFKMPNKPKTKYLNFKVGQYVDYIVPDQGVRHAIIDKENGNNKYNLNWKNPQVSKKYNGYTVDVESQSKLWRTGEEHIWIKPINSREEYKRRKENNEDVDINNLIHFLNFSPEERKEKYEENFKKYQEDHLSRKLKNFDDNKGDLDIKIKIYTYIFPNDSIRENFNENINLDLEKKFIEVNKEFSDFVRSKLINYKSVNDLLVTRREVINFCDEIDEHEKDFFYNCQAQGSVIDMMKFKSSKKEKNNNCLIIDSNTEVPSYKKLIEDTFKHNMDGFAIAYYKDHLNVNNKIYYHLQNSPFVKELIETMGNFFKLIKENKVEREKILMDPSNNYVFDILFKNIIFKLDIAIKYQYGKHIQYDINYDKKDIKELLRLTKHYIPAINMSWNTKSSEKIKADEIQLDDAKINIQGFLGTIKKYLISGIESNSCKKDMGEKDPPAKCLSNEIDGVNSIKKWRLKRNFFIKISDRNFDNRLVFKFLEKNFTTLKDYCRRSIASELVTNIKSKNLNILKEKGIPGFKREDLDKMINKRIYDESPGYEIAPGQKIRLMGDKMLSKERKNEAMNQLIKQKEFKGKSIISNEKLIEQLLELYNLENEASYFSKSKYEMCDLIARLDFIHTTVFNTTVEDQGISPM
jgi:hypothetical protein